MAHECDVLVVGAGPAGSSAARAAAAAGAHTICIDKKRAIGVPVQCGEGIGAYLFPFLPFKIPQDLLIWTLEEISLWAGGSTVTRAGRLWTTYMLNRNDFDAWLAKTAEFQGAHVLTNTELVDLEVDSNNTVTNATIRTPEGEKQIKPRVVIAGDGVDSTVLKLLGFKIDKRTTCGKVLSYELNNLRLGNPKSFQVFLGDFAPGAYAYILPKSRTTANVGAGTIVPQKKVKSCYEEFLELPQVKKQLSYGVVVADKSGWAPIRHLTDKWVYGNVLLVGDVANQNFKPFVEGIIPTLICGDQAGKTAAEFIRGKSPLDTYPNRVRDKLGTFFSESDQLIPLLYESGASTDRKEDLLRLALFANIISMKQFEKLKHEDASMIESIVEKWNRSTIRQPLANIAERLGFLYLRIASK
ncbi:MAG: NAD(P)/FAD-dependent oxidoreductase [Methanomicrobia archaeon]|nr:NAD(P)/FAD-dependent oxidoreductase [Methanomicrobia archaeon]